MTKEDFETVKLMIDAAIDKHNKSAALISALLGFTLLGFYTHGVITIVERVSTP
jgi:hypothetical protein